MVLLLIKNNGFTFGKRLTLLDGNTLLCRNCGGRFFWKGELIDFNPLGFNQINRRIECGRESYYDIEELKKHEVSFVELWAEP